MTESTELYTARMVLAERVDEWHRVAEADESTEEGRSRIAPDGKYAHLGRVNAAGQKALRHYERLSGDMQQVYDLIGGRERFPMPFHNHKDEE